MHRVPGLTASGRRSPLEWLPALILALLLAVPAGADVVIKEKTVSEGLAGFGNGTTSRTLIVAGDKSRSEDEFTYTGRFKTLAGGGKPRKSVSITRLDREVVWDLEPDRKLYSETTFAEMRRLSSESKDRLDAEAGKAEAKDADMTFTVDVKRTGVRQNVNGFAAEQVIVTSVGRPKNPKKGEESSEIRMVMDLWLTKSAPGAQELAAFHRRFAEKLGLDMRMAGIDAAARGMYGNGLKQMEAGLKGLGDQLVRSTFTVEGSGAIADARKQADEAAAQSSEERAQEKEAEAKEEKAANARDAEQLGTSVAVGGGVAGKIGGFLGRKVAGAAQRKAKEKAEKKAGETSSPGEVGGGPLMKVVTDVTSISTSPAPAGSFDIPAGYRLQKKD